VGPGSLCFKSAWIGALLILSIGGVGWSICRILPVSADPAFIHVSGSAEQAADPIWGLSARLANGSAIQHALDSLPASGGVVKLGPGTFECDQPVVIKRSGVHLMGSGADTLLRLTNRANCPLLIVGDPRRDIQTAVANVRVTDLMLDGNRLYQQVENWGNGADGPDGTAVRNNCITLRCVHDSRFERITALRGRSGGMVLEKGCRNILVDGFTALDNEFDGLAGYETENSTFKNLKLHGNQSAGISLDLRFNKNHIERAELHKNGSQGIFMRESNGNRFNNLSIRENGAQGVFIAQADHLTETGCRDNQFINLNVFANKGHGLRVNDSSCVGNTVRDSEFKQNVPGQISSTVENLIATSVSAGN
jgi:polygalacturonase